MLSEDVATVGAILWLEDSIWRKKLLAGVTAVAGMLMVGVSGTGRAETMLGVASGRGAPATEA
jgi:hypothetical protein